MSEFFTAEDFRWATQRCFTAVELAMTANAKLRERETELKSRSAIHRATIQNPGDVIREIETLRRALERAKQGILIMDEHITRPICYQEREQAKQDANKFILEIDAALKGERG